MMGINVKDIVLRKDNILSSVVDDETVLLCIENSKYYGIDPVGTSIWNLLDEPRSIELIIITMQELYDVSAEQCRTDVLRFINHLVEKNLVKLQSA